MGSNKSKAQPSNGFKSKIKKSKSVLDKISLNGSYFKIYRKPVINF